MKNIFANVGEKGWLFLGGTIIFALGFALVIPCSSSSERVGGFLLMTGAGILIYSIGRIFD